MNSYQRSTLHLMDAQFIESITEPSGTTLSNQYTMIRPLVHPRHCDLGTKLSLFRELGNTSIRSYVNIRLNIFDQLLAYVSQIQITSGVLPTYITREFINTESIDWLLQHGCLYKKMNGRSLFDILCISYLFTDILQFRITTSIYKSNMDVVREYIHSLNTELFVSSHQLYTICGYWNCLIDSTRGLYVDGARSINDYPDNLRDSVHTILLNNMQLYTEFLGISYTFEYEIYQYLRDIKEMPMTRYLSRTISERTQLVNILQRTIQKMLSPSIFSQSIDWMCSKWTNGEGIEDLYLSDVSTQIKSITNMLQYVHTIRPYSYYIQSTRELIELNDTRCLIPVPETYQRFAEKTDLILFIMKPTSPISMHMRVQFLTAIPFYTWKDVIERENDKNIGELFRILIENYVSIESYNEHNGFQQQLEYRNAILQIVLMRPWITDLFKIDGLLGFQMLTLIQSHSLKLVDSYSELVLLMMSHTTQPLTRISNLERIQTSRDMEDSLEALHITIHIASQIAIGLMMTTDTTNLRRGYNSYIDFVIGLTRKISLTCKQNQWYSTILLMCEKYKERIKKFGDTIYMMIDVLKEFIEGLDDVYTVHPDIEGWLEEMQRYDEMNRMIESKSISELVQSISAIHDRRLNKYTTDIPNQFLDPILFYEMDVPMELPDTKILVDEWCILRHIVIEKNNPYTRKSLTIEELLEYQKREDVADRVGTYNASFRIWKDANRVAFD
jgi:spore coat protein CotF